MKKVRSQKKSNLSTINVRDKKKRILIMNNTDKKHKIIWIHQFFPYIQEVHFDLSSHTLDQLVSSLNQAISFPHFDLIYKEIHDLQDIDHANQIASNKLDEVKDMFSFFIHNYPFILKWHIKEWIDHLKSLLSKLKQPHHVTVDEIKAFWRVFESSEGKIDDSKMADAHGWFIKSDAFKVNQKNHLAEEEKKKIKKNLENVGKAGIIRLECAPDDIYYMAEDENVFRAIKEIISFIDFEEMGVDYTYNGKYQQDAFLQEMVEYKEINEYYLDYCVIKFYTDYQFKDEKVRKEALRDMKNNQYKVDYLPSYLRRE